MGKWPNCTSNTTHIHTHAVTTAVRKVSHITTTIVALLPHIALHPRGKKLIKKSDIYNYIVYIVLRRCMY